MAPAASPLSAGVILFCGADRYKLRSPRKQAPRFSPPFVYRIHKRTEKLSLAYADDPRHLPYVAQPPSVRVPPLDIVGGFVDSEPVAEFRYTKPRLHHARP